MTLNIHFYVLKKIEFMFLCHNLKDFFFLLCYMDLLLHRLRPEKVCVLLNCTEFFAVRD